MWTSGLQPVVLGGGRGSRMTELIGSSVPKCLLPFGGNPLIFYPLKSLEVNGFAGKEVLVIIQERDDIRRTILKLGEKLNLIIDVFGVPEDSEEFGTAESLRLAITAKKITRDALVLSCDLVGELPIQQLLNLHGLKGSDFTSLYMKRVVPGKDAVTPGPRSKHVVERDIVGVHEEGRLVFMGSEADLEDELILPSSMLQKFQNFKLYTSLTDCHLYVIKKKVLEKLFETVDGDDEKHLSLKGEFLPWIVQKSSDPKKDDKEEMKCYTLVEPEKRCLRVNSIQSYCLACQSGEWLKEVYLNCVSRAKETKIAKGCKMVSLTLGDHCTVGEKCKLINVISMDHVKIEEKCELQNVIISSNAQIGAGALLKDCLIGPKYQVPAGARLINEHLTVMDDNFFEP